MEYPFCPNCGSKGTLAEDVKTELIDIKGDKIPIESKVTKCSNCRDEFSSVKDAFVVIEKAREIYRTRRGIPSPDQLQRFMDDLKLSLRDMQYLTGIAYKTIDRYLKGAIPDPPNALLLKIIMNNPIELYNALHSNPHFKATRFNRVKTKLTAEKSSLHDNLADKIAREIILLNSDTLSVAKFSSKKTCTIPLAKNYSGTVNNSCMFGKFVIPLTY